MDSTELNPSNILDIKYQKEINKIIYRGGGVSLSLSLSQLESNYFGAKCPDS
jgi:hypothetical protein